MTKMWRCGMTFWHRTMTTRTRKERLKAGRGASFPSGTGPAPTRDTNISRKKKSAKSTPDVGKILTDMLLETGKRRKCWKSAQPGNRTSERRGATGFRRWCATAQKRTSLTSRRKPWPCPSAISQRMRGNVRVVSSVQLHLPGSRPTPRPPSSTTKTADTTAGVYATGNFHAVAGRLLYRGK